MRAGDTGQRSDQEGESEGKRGEKKDECDKKGAGIRKTRIRRHSVKGNRGDDG